jgi:hypothetical protein
MTPAIGEYCVGVVPRLGDVGERKLLLVLWGDSATFVWSNFCQTVSSLPPRLFLYVSTMLTIILGSCSCSVLVMPLSASMRCQSAGSPYETY